MTEYAYNFDSQYIIICYLCRFLEKQFSKAVDMKIKNHPIYSPITIKTKNSSVSNLCSPKCKLFIEKRDEDGFRYLERSPDADNSDDLF